MSSFQQLTVWFNINPENSGQTANEKNKTKKQKAHIATSDFRGITQQLQ